MNREPTTALTCSTLEAAKLLGISVRTAQLWVEEGRLNAWKTPGGHRRILRESVERIVQQQRQAANPGTTPFAILVLDSDAGQRIALKRLLEYHLPEAQIAVAVDAFEGLMRIGEQPPDVLITDLGLAGLDSLRMLERLSRIPHPRGFLIIVLVAAGADLKALASRLPAAAMVLAKPVDGDELVRLVRAFQQGWQARRSAP